jgi:voltage-gated potassium channel
MASALLRWRVLRDMDQWLTVPMALLSLAWLLIVVWELVSGTSALLETVGIVIWVIFIAEFAIRLALAPDKAAFLKSNWLTVIALAVPALRLFRALRVLRAARALRGVRLVRIVGTANRSMNALRSTLARRGFGYVAGLTVLVVGLGAAGMLSFENAREVDGGFDSYWDALWWTGMLVTSIGSDFWPATTEGRLLTLLLSLYGLAVLGYITATLASFFVGRDAQNARAPIASAADIKAVLDEVRALRRELRDKAA